MEITKEMKADYKAIRQYIVIINQSSPTRAITVGKIETNQTISREMEIESNKRFVPSFDSEELAEEACRKFKNQGFVKMNNFDWYYNRVAYLKKIIAPNK